MLFANFPCNPVSPRLRETKEDEKFTNKDRELGSMVDMFRKSRVSSLISVAFTMTFSRVAASILIPRNERSRETNFESREILGGITPLNAEADRFR